MEIPSFCELLDSTRDTLAERYLLESCDDIFVVSDGNVHETSVTLAKLDELSKLASLTKIGVICTGSDVVSLYGFPDFCDFL